MAHAPYGPCSIWALAYVGSCLSGPSPLWALAHTSIDPYGLGPYGHAMPRPWSYYGGMTRQELPAKLPNTYERASIGEHQFSVF